MTLLAPLFQEVELPGLEALLCHLCAAAQVAWPALPLPAEDFVPHLRRHCPAGCDPLVVLPSLYVEDLYLACACARGLPPALLAFESRHLAPIGQLLPRSQADPALIDELRQLLRERLLVGGGAPRIAEFSGRGSLLSFVRTVATRLLMDLRRQRAAAPLPVASDDAALAGLADDPDPELAFIKGRYRAAFYQTLQDALRGLPTQQRHLLRLHYVDGLSLDRMGEVLGSHRSMVYRWLLDARAAAQRSARALLCQRLQLSATEYESLVGLVRSQLEVNLAAGLSITVSPGETER